MPTCHDNFPTLHPMGLVRPGGALRWGRFKPVTLLLLHGIGAALPTAAATALVSACATHTRRAGAAGRAPFFLQTCGYTGEARCRAPAWNLDGEGELWPRAKKPKARRARGA